MDTEFPNPPRGLPAPENTQRWVYWFLKIKKYIDSFDSADAYSYEPFVDTSLLESSIADLEVSVQSVLDQDLSEINSRLNSLEVELTASSPEDLDDFCRRTADETISGSWTFTSNVTISKNDPAIWLTDSGDSNSAKLVRSDTDGKVELLNTVNRPSLVGNALLFDGVDEFVSVPDHADFTFVNSSFTISAWVMFKNVGKVGCWYSQWVTGSTPTSGQVRIEWFNTTNLIRFIAYDYSGGYKDTLATCAFTPVIDTWYHIVFVRRGSTPEIYIDNVSKSVSIDGWNTYINLAADVHIGVQDGTSVYANIELDEYGIWNKALSVNDITDLYNSGAGLIIDPATNFPTDGGSMSTNLIAVWHFDESSGTNVADSSGNAHNGTTQNMEDGDWVPGLIMITPGADTEINVISAEDGLESAEAGIITIGQDGANAPRLALHGKTIRFLVGGSEVSRFDADGILQLENGDSTLQAIMLTEAVAQSANMLEHLDSSDNIVNSLTAGGGAVLGGNSTIGRGETGVDYTLTFDGETNDGVITWMEDEDYFSFSDGIMMSTSEAINFRDSAIGIYSQADTFLDTYTDGGFRIGDSSAGAPTNYTKFASDGSISQYGTARRDLTKYTAASVSITTGGTDATSVVSYLQSENDGNVFHLDEVGGATPGLDFYVEFTGVTAFNHVAIRAIYVGSTTHAISISLYDWVATAWKSKQCLQTGVYSVVAQQEVICNRGFIVPDDTNYIGTSGDAGKVRIRFVHPVTGNGAHDVYVDLVALYQ